MRGLLVGALLWWAAGAPAASPPLAEIREVLARHLFPAPTPEQLRALGDGDLVTRLRAIDAFARWYSPAEYAREAIPEEGVGVGAALARWNGRYVLAPYADSPLARLGFAGPVYLEAVEGQNVVGLDPGTVAQRLRGEPGTSVRITVRRGAREGADDCRVLRGPYRRISVERVAAGNRPVIRIRDFVTRETRTLLAIALAEHRDPRGQVILDLRDSPGGDLFEALDSAALFVPEGQRLATALDRTAGAQDFVAPAGTKFIRSPLVLWVGPGTASAAEVFAGILQQRGLAHVVGERTFGKCSSQTDIRLSDGSVLRLTNRQLLLPADAPCSGQGLTPDVRVSGDAFLDDETLLGASRGAL